MAPTCVAADCNQVNTPRLTLSYSCSLKCERPSIGSDLLVLGYDRNVMVEHGGLHRRGSTPSESIKGSFYGYKNTS